MWMHIDDARAFAPAEPPPWVLDWMGRRRRSGGAAPKAEAAIEAKNLAAASETAEPQEIDLAAAARRQASAEKRAADTKRQVSAGLDDLELWIADQLRTGLA